MKKIWNGVGLLEKFVSMFILMMMVNFSLFRVLKSIFSSVNISGETLLYTIGTIIIILLSLIFSLLFYITNLLKEKM